MAYNQIAKQVIDFQKTSFSSWYDAVTLIQNQASSAVDTMLDQSTWIPEDGRQAILSWIDVCEQERDRLKRYIDDSFTGVEKLVSSGKKSSPAKAKKAAAA